MTRPTLIFVCIAIVLAGFEGAADAAGSIAGDKSDASHELHGSVHPDDHHHDGHHDDHHEGDTDHDHHFCHCSLHAVALLSTTVKAAMQKGHVSPERYNSSFPSQAPTPPLRPPQ